MRADANTRLWRVICVVAFAVGLVAGGAAQNVQAAQITFNFEGTVTFVGADIAGTFSPGQTLSGSYTFDSATPDSNPDPTVGSYIGALKALNFTVGAYTGTLGAGTNGILVLNDFSGRDEYDVAGHFSGADVAGLTPGLFHLPDLADPTQSAFSSDALPTAPPNLSLFTTRGFLFHFQNLQGDIDACGNFSSGPCNFFGTITSLTSAPEPSTLLLLGSGLIGLAGFGKKRFFKK